MLDPLIRTIEVSCGQAEAFRIFVHEMGSWWPLAKRSMSLKAVGKPAKALHVDARVGGRIVEIGPDDSEHHWGTITEMKPNDSVRFDFHMGMPPAQASVVDVTFAPLSAGRTRVTLRQSNWEALGDMAEMLRGFYGSSWELIFDEAYGKACVG